MLKTKVCFLVDLKHSSESEVSMSSHLHYFNPEAEAIFFPKEI